MSAGPASRARDPIQMIFLHYSQFDTEETYFSRQSSFQLPHLTSDTIELIHHAYMALTRILRPGIHYNECSVMLTEFIPDTEHQGDLLDTRDRASTKKLMATLDAINRRDGRNTLFYCAAGTTRHWTMAAAKKSRHFTTDWQQLSQVTA
jgi:DNA polymerase V